MWRMISAPHLCLTACEIARLQGLMDDMAGLWRDRRQHYPCAGKNLSTFDDLWCRGGFEVGFFHPLLTWQILRGSIELEPGRVSALLVKLWPFMTHGWLEIPGKKSLPHWHCLHLEVNGHRGPFDRHISSMGPTQVTQLPQFHYLKYQRPGDKLLFDHSYVWVVAT